MVASSILLTEKARIEGKHSWYCILFAVLLIQTAFGCYQVLTVVYMTGAATAFLIFCLKQERTVKQQFQWLGFHVGVFLAGFAVYFVIARTFFMGGSVYLEGQIAWQQGSLREGLRQCLGVILYALGNNPPYYTGFYRIFAAALIALTIFRMWRAGIWKKGSSVLFILAELFLVIAPFIFILFLGGGMSTRIQLVMPLAQGCILYLIVLLFPSRKTWEAKPRKILVQGILLFFAIALYRDAAVRLNSCNGLYYTYDWAYQYDVEISRKVYFDVRDAKTICGLDDSFDEILFLGYPDIPYNETCIEGDTMGGSFFHWDFSEGEARRKRIQYFMRNQGHPVECYFSEGQEAAYRAYFQDYFGERVDAMPSYPDEGYVQFLRDDEIGLEYLVVKLGPDWR